MAVIGFIGLGNMGAGMAVNLAKVGHDVRAFDLSEAAISKASEQLYAAMEAKGEDSLDFSGIMRLIKGEL